MSDRKIGERTLNQWQAINQDWKLFQTVPPIRFQELLDAAFSTAEYQRGLEDAARKVETQPGVIEGWRATELARIIRAIPVRALALTPTAQEKEKA